MHLEDRKTKCNLPFSSETRERERERKGERDRERTAIGERSKRGVRKEGTNSKSMVDIVNYSMKERPEKRGRIGQQETEDRE